MIAEAARVLKPGGLLIMTFDICEPDMGMSFPEWNGRALSMREFDELFKESLWFEPGLSELPWDKDGIQDYLSWHRTTAPWHNYVTAGAVVRRNNRIWKEPPQKSWYRVLRGEIHTIASVIIWYLLQRFNDVKLKVIRLAKAFTLMNIQNMLRTLKQMWSRLTTLPLESLSDAPDLFSNYRYLCSHPEVKRQPGGWFYKGRFYPDYLTVGGKLCYFS